MVSEYIEAFHTCYPHKSIEVKPKKVKGEIMFRVIIDKEPGDILLTPDDMKFATRLFKRGK